MCNAHRCRAQFAEGAPRTYFDLNAINTLSNNLVGQFLPAPGSTEASRFASATAARALTVLVDAVSSNASLVAALSADANREKRAKELVIARDDINYAVEDALFGNAEPSKIFDTMKSNLKKQAGGSVDAAASAQSHNKEAMQTFTTMALVQNGKREELKSNAGVPGSTQTGLGSTKFDPSRRGRSHESLCRLRGNGSSACQGGRSRWVQLSLVGRGMTRVLRSWRSCVWDRRAAPAPRVSGAWHPAPWR